MNSIKLALRTLWTTPFVTAVAAVSLGLGIGANAAIFSVFDQVLMRSLPVAEPDRLVNLAAPGPMQGSTSCGQAGGCEVIFSYAMFRDLEAAETGLDGVAAHVLFGANLAFDGLTTSGRGILVSGSYFPILGVQPALGRLLDRTDDERIGENFVAVLSHSYWENQLGRDPNALNSTIVVNGQSMTVVGVAAAGFAGTTLGAEPAVYVPLTMRGLMQPGWDGFENRRSYWAYVFGRLAPGVSVEQAVTSINSVYTAILEEVEVPLQAGMSDRTLELFRAKRVQLEAGHRGQSSFNAEARTPLILLFSITGFVLLIACANVANLLLARGASRMQEMALRSSLGASRAQLIRQLLTEATLLALLGGVASLAVGRVTLLLLARSVPPDAGGGLSFALSAKVVLFAGALSLVTGLLFGLYPALHSTRSDLVTMLKAGGGQPTGARAAARFRSTLVTAQIALSLALLASAGLFVKSLLNVSRVQLGLEVDNLVAFGVSPELNGYEPARSMDLFVRLESELAAIPGVTAVTAALVPILSGNNWGTSVSVQGFESGPDIDNNSRLNQVGPGYFGALGIPLLAGREFDDSDAEGAPRVAIVNEAFTRKFGLDGRNAVGAFMDDSDGSGAELDMQIVGVVQDASYADVKQAVPPLFFTPYRQNDETGRLAYYVRSGIDPSSVMRAIPAAVQRLDPNLPVERLKTLEQQVRENVYGDRLIGAFSAAFATLATLLAAVGLYGVLAFTVAQRTREIGVRMALGARASNVQAMVLKQVTRMVLVGGAVGLAVAYGIGRVSQSLLYGLEGDDPVILALVAAVMTAVAFAAGYLPALRASRVDPVDALRHS